MTNIIVPYPESRQKLFQEIEQKNDEKKADLPLALVLIATYDFSGALTDSSKRFFLSTIANMHQVSCRNISKKEDVRQSIHQVTNSSKRRISLLVFDAHGTSSSMFLGDKDIYKMEDVSSEDFSELDENARIFLAACDTGNRLAQKIANVANRMVFAPIKLLISLRTCLFNCSTHGLEMRSYSKINESNVQHVAIFQKNKPCFFCLSKREDDKHYFEEQLKYQKNAADSGEEGACISLGWIYLETDNFAEAEIWLKKAVAMTQSMEAFFSLGRLYACKAAKEEEEEQKKVYREEAQVWYHKAAAKEGKIPIKRKWVNGFLQKGELDNAELFLQEAVEEGEIESQRILGKIYEKKGMLAETEEKKKECWSKAENLYRKVADKGDVSAQYLLGNFYKRQKDLSKAKYWYRKAANQGDLDSSICFFQICKAQIQESENDPEQKQQCFQKVEPNTSSSTKRIYEEKRDRETSKRQHTLSQKN